MQNHEAPVADINKIMLSFLKDFKYLINPLLSLCLIIYTVIQFSKQET